ncbi:hypothetical protein FJZ26_00980 [Candidatus Parvarchaeota archaeon]|nr:hypothetical protein [Candidatus Parvarchaeota archaeon]
MQRQKSEGTNILADRKFGFLLAILIVFASVLVLGCVTARPRQADINLTLQPFNVSCPDINGSQCICLTCKNKTSIIPILGGSSLAQGTCSFQSCNQTTLEELESRTSEFPWIFMIGQGPNFGDFDSANRLCNNSLSMSVNWLVGNPGVPQLTGKLKQSATNCLQNRVMPVFIYYTAKQNIDKVAMENIARELKDIGPVIISTEFNVSVDEPASFQQARDQALAIKSRCPNCFVAMTPPTMDNKTIAAIVSDPQLNQSVDMIGQGIFLNDYAGSADITTAYWDNVAFAEQTSIKYGKPTIWLFVAAAPGPNAAGTSWSEQEVADIYYTASTKSFILPSVGIIGMASYGFNTSILPGKGAYRVAADGGAQLHPVSNGWFEGCLQYSRPYMQSIIVYPKQGSNPFQCTFGQNINLISLTSVQFGAATSPYSNAQMPQSNFAFACKQA